MARISRTTVLPVDDAHPAIAAELPRFQVCQGRKIVAGVALAIAGLLLIIATHLGHFS